MDFLFFFGGGPIKAAQIPPKCVEAKQVTWPRVKKKILPTYPIFLIM